MIHRSIRLLLVCILVVLCSALVLAQDSVKLEQKFRLNELVRYKFVMDGIASLSMDAPSQPNTPGGTMQLPPMNIRAVAVIRMRTKQLFENGDALVNVAVESLKIETPGGNPGIPTDRIPVMKMVLTRDGRVRSMDIPNVPQAQQNMSQVMQGMSLMPAPLPANEVKAGDAWSQNIPMPSNIPGMQTPITGGVQVNYRLDSTRNKMGKYTVAMISADTVMQMGFNGPVPMPPGVQANGSPTVNLQLNLTGREVTAWDTELGREVRSDMTMAGQGTLNMQGMPLGAGPNIPGNMKVDFQAKGYSYLLPTN